MATKKYRKRKKNRHGESPIMTVTIQPREVPSDADPDHHINQHGYSDRESDRDAYHHLYAFRAAGPHPTRHPTGQPLLALRRHIPGDVPDVHDARPRPISTP